MQIYGQPANSHLVPLKESFHNRDYVFMIMPYYNCTDLLNCIREVKIEENLAKHLFKQLLYSLQYLHSIGERIYLLLLLELT